jgi:hypothetical protein
MMKLIKLLFPKVYTSIFNEGYAKGQLDYSEHGPIDDYQYDDDEYQTIELYEQEYYDMIEHENQHYQDLYDREEEYPEDDIVEDVIPVSIKPNLEIGDKIHLHSKEGMYTIVSINPLTFGYRTKHSDVSYTKYDDYKCHAGGFWNFKG